MRMMMLTMTLLGLGFLSAPARMKWLEDTAHGLLTVQEGENNILTYRFGDQLKPGVDSKYVQSCYIHPLFSPDGQPLTDDFPEDHFHHHGLFWTWPVVRTRGLTTSTWEPKLPRLRQHFGRWLKREAARDSFLLGAENSWKLEGKEVVAREIVTLHVHPAGKAGRAIDLELSLEAVGGPLELQGTPDQNKGYGGLCFRGAPMFMAATMTTDKGVLKEDAVHTPFLWADLSTADGGLAIFVSPDHPDFPTKWMVRASYAGIINVSWPGLGSAVLQPGEPVILRYRIYVHRGDAETGGVKTAYSQYIGQ